jgi:hypothetical protein
MRLLRIVHDRLKLTQEPLARFSVRLGYAHIISQGPSFSTIQTYATVDLTATVAVFIKYGVRMLLSDEIAEQLPAIRPPANKGLEERKTPSMQLILQVSMMPISCAIEQSTCRVT